MSKRKNEMYVQYAAKILSTLSPILTDEDSENHIGLEELQEGDNLKHFIHALGTVASCHLFNQFTGGDKSWLEFNHVANTLIFEYANKSNEERDVS